MTAATWTVRGRVSGRRYVVTPLGAGHVRLTHRSGVSSVMAADVVARDYDIVATRAAR